MNQSFREIRRLISCPEHGFLGTSAIYALFEQKMLFPHRVNPEQNPLPIVTQLWCCGYDDMIVFVATWPSVNVTSER